MSELLSEISMHLKMEDILNSENMIPIENVKELIDELQQKENIIKEVREYIKNTIEIIKEQPSKDFNDDLWILNRLNRFLKILDKENDNE